MFHYINTRLPLTFILAALFLVSCSDEINEKKQTQHESTCRLSQFVQVSSGLRDTSKFEYDADGNLTVYTLIEDRESFTYNLNYNKNNEIEEIRNAKDGDIFQFFYSGNNISQMVSSYNFSNSASNVTEFDYNEVGQVIQIKEYAFDEITNEKYLIERINYSWNRNNIASCTMLYGDSLNEKTVISFLNFDYFDNPFYNLPLWYLEFNRPNSLFTAGTFGSCGTSIPMAVGARFADKDRPIFALVGDGAVNMQGINELLTCKRNNLGITIICFRNEVWGAELLNQLIWTDARAVGTEIDNPSISGIAEAFGAVGVTVDGSEENFEKVLKESIERQKNGETTLIEVMCTPNMGAPFRSDAMRCPERHLEKYKHLTTDYADYERQYTYEGRKVE